MRNLLLIVCVLLIGGPVLAQDFVETKAEYRKQIRLKLGVDTSSSGYLTDDAANAFISEALTFALPLIKGKKIVTSFVTAYRDGDYPLDPTMDGIFAVWWSQNDSVKPLSYLPISQWGNADHQSTKGNPEGALKRPSYYDYSDDSLFVYPIPYASIGDTIKVLGWAEEVSTATDTSFAQIPQKYRTVIVNYAAWLAAEARSDPRAERIFQVLLWSLQAVNGNPGELEREARSQNN